MKFKFDPDVPVIIFEPELKGVNITTKIKMVLDTGATYTMIPWSIAKVLGLEPEVSKRRIEITTASGVESVPLVIVKSIFLSDKKVEDVEVIIHDLPPRSYVDGLLGLSFLKNFKICIDFPKGILEIE